MKQVQVRSGVDYVELSLLNTDGSKPPSVDLFPGKFNPSGLKVWEELMASEEYGKAKRHFRNLDEDWSWCIRAYLKLCGLAGIFPFASATEQSNNDFVVQYLINARRRAIKFIDDIELFKKVRVFSTSREYRILSDGFVVITTAHLTPIKDPTFVKWLQTHSPGPMFRPTGKAPMSFVRELFDNVDSRVVFHINLVNMVRPQLKMLVSCGTPLAYNHVRNGAPSRSDLEKFAEETIWLPLVRSHRFSGIFNRLF